MTTWCAATGAGNIGRTERLAAHRPLTRPQVSLSRGILDLLRERERSVGAWLEPYRRFWSGRLDALERHLDEAPYGIRTSVFPVTGEDRRSAMTSAGYAASGSASVAPTNSISSVSARCWCDGQ